MLGVFIFILINFFDIFYALYYLIHIIHIIHSIPLDQESNSNTLLAYRNVLIGTKFSLTTNMYVIVAEILLYQRFLYLF